MRNGKKIKDAIDYYLERDNLPKQWEVTVETFDTGRDINGNRTAHYEAYIVDRAFNRFNIVSSGIRRKQVGCSGRNESALYALEKLGYELCLAKSTSYDNQGVAVYPLLNLNKV